MCALGKFGGVFEGSSCINGRLWLFGIIWVFRGIFSVFGELVAIRGMHHVLRLREIYVNTQYVTKTAYETQHTSLKNVHILPKNPDISS